MSCAALLSDPLQGLMNEYKAEAARWGNPVLPWRHLQTPMVWGLKFPAKAGERLSQSQGFADGRARAGSVAAGTERND